MAGTGQVFYAEPHRCAVATHVVRTGNDFIEVADTVAFPKSDDQEPDHGVIRVEGHSLRFTDVRRLHGVPVGPDFPGVETQSHIWHRIHHDDRALLAQVKPDAEATVMIDARRRARLVLSHTALHLAAISVAVFRPDAMATLGSRINNIQYGQLDFPLDPVLSTSDFEGAIEYANDLIRRDVAVHTLGHPQWIEARTFLCAGHAIACDGLHLQTAGAIGPLHMTRLDSRPGRERLRIDFPDANVAFTAYYFDVSKLDKGITNVSAGFLPTHKAAFPDRPFPFAS